MKVLGDECLNSGRGWWMSEVNHQQQTLPDLWNSTWQCLLLLTGVWGCLRVTEWYLWMSDSHLCWFWFWWVVFVGYSSVKTSQNGAIALFWHPLKYKIYFTWPYGDIKMSRYKNYKTAQKLLWTFVPIKAILLLTLILKHPVGPSAKNHQNFTKFQKCVWRHKCFSKMCMRA